MRRAARLDDNHIRIVKTLRQIGASVQSLAAIGKGCPDLLVCRHNVLVLMEVKDGDKKPSARRLTEDEEKWHATWGGDVHVVNSVDEAISVVDRYCVGK